MPTRKRKTVIRKNVVTARRAWRRKPSPARSRSIGPTRARAKPGTRATGDFYHVEVRPKGGFRTFRTQDVGKQGGIERVAGRRARGAWQTQKWLIGKEHAHVEGGKLVADTPDARKVLGQLSTPRRVRGDRFKARPAAKLPRRTAGTRGEARARFIAKGRSARRARANQGRPPPPGAPRA